MVRVQGTMAPMRHLHLILFLLVALNARTVWTSPWQAQEAGKRAALLQPVPSQGALLPGQRGCFFLSGALLRAASECLSGLHCG